MRGFKDHTQPANLVKLWYPSSRLCNHLGNHLDRIFTGTDRNGPNYRIASGWLGGAMALSKLPVPRRPTIWMIVGQGPTAFAVGVGGGVWAFFLSLILSLLCLLSFGRRPHID